MSRLLLENSNNAQEPAQLDPIQEAGLNWSENTLAILWETPRASRDVYLQANTITRLGETDLPIRRQLFRKIIKGFEEKDYALVQAELQIKQLEARLEQVAPRKRRKVRTSPNSKFASLRTIRQAQIEAGDCEIKVEGSIIFIDSTSTGDCIEVQGL